MLEQFNIWEFIAGLGVFLYGMSLLEDSLKQLGGRSFKKFLKKHTSNKYKAVLSGTLLTAVLQSSSVVSLMTLAFVGAGIISMRNALGIIFGSNLGTTFTGWVVATLGFKLDIIGIALPFIGIGAIIAIVMSRWEKIAAIGRFFIGFGFIFLGLDFMKVSIANLAANFDLSQLPHYGILIFILTGFIITAIIQSSSAMMVITLSALSSGIIDFPSAAGIVIGGDIGTTITALIGGMPGIAAKKRVAVGHFLFNVTIGLFAYVFLDALIILLKDIFQIKDEILALVAFHSTINLIGIILFLPFINYFANFLDNRFKTETGSVSKHIKQVTTEVPEAALTALTNEANDLINMVIAVQKGVFKSPQKGVFSLTNNPVKEKYFDLKQLEGEMFKFYTALQQQTLNNEESSKLHQLMLVMRYGLHAAKSIKDIDPNLQEFYDSSKHELNEFYDLLKLSNQTLMSRLHKIMENKITDTEELLEISKLIAKDYDNVLHKLNDAKYRKKLTEMEISTVLTVNREIFSGHKSLLYAFTYYYLTSEQSRQFLSMPIG